MSSSPWPFRHSSGRVPLVLGQLDGMPSQAAPRRHRWPIDVPVAHRQGLHVEQPLPPRSRVPLLLADRRKPRRRLLVEPSHDLIPNRGGPLRRPCGTGGRPARSGPQGHGKEISFHGEDGKPPKPSTQRPQHRSVFALGQRPTGDGRVDGPYLRRRVHYLERVGSARAAASECPSRGCGGQRGVSVSESWCPRQCLVSGHSSALSRDIVPTSSQGVGRCRWRGWWSRRSGSRDAVRAADAAGATYLTRWVRSHRTGIQAAENASSCWRPHGTRRHRS